MKQTTPLVKLLLMFVWTVLGLRGFSQTPTYEMYVTNQSQIDSKTYQFDIYLLRTGSTELKLSGIQFGLAIDTSIANGGALSFTQVSGSPQYVSSNVPSFAVGSTVQTVNGVAYRYLNQSAVAGPGASNATSISSVKNGCSSPGTRIGTYRLTNSVDFRQASSCKHFFSTSTNKGPTTTLVSAYIGTTSTNITNAAGHFAYNTTGSCDQNLSLNGCAVVASITSNTGVTCFGGSNGSVTISLSGTGSASSGTYSVDGGTAVSYSSNPFTVSGLSAGSHSIGISSGLCSASTGSFTISGPSSALSSSFSASGCDSYALPWGTTVTESGAYTHVYTSAAGCDSTVTANITITASTSNATPASACDSYTWSVNGQTYTTSGSYSSTTGCHTEILNLTITASTSSASSASACDSYVWSANSQTYTESGSYTSVSGCATSILNLTVNASTSSSSDVTACDSYSLPWGTEVTTSGAYSNVYTSAGGCDSTVTVNVTINNSTNTTESASICSNEVPYVWTSGNGQSYSTSGTYSFTYTNEAGCSSVATLVLTVNSTSSSTANRTVCSNQLPYTWNDVIFTGAGTQNVTLTNAAGCDSVVTMTLGVSGGTPTAVTAVTQTLVANNCGARVYRYTAGSVANASGYEWTLPTGVGGVAGVTVDSGDITSSRVIRLMYASNAAALTTDSIKVRAYSGCGTAARKGFKLTNLAWAPLAAAATITATNVVTNVCGARKVRYSVASPLTTSGALGFEWSLEGTYGGVIDSGLGSRVITVVYANDGASTTSDNVVFRYNYNDGCSFGTPVKKAIALAAIGRPAAPTVTNTVLNNNVCGGRKVRFSVPSFSATPTATAVAGTGYAWSFNGTGLHATDGTTYVVDSMDAAGLSASRVIVVRYISNTAQVTGSDNVTCAYTTACGNGATSAVKAPGLISALGQPIAPTVTNAVMNNNVCGGRRVRFSAPALPTTWTTANVAQPTGYSWQIAASGSGLHATEGTTYVIDSGSLTSQRFVIRYLVNTAQTATDLVSCAYTTACGTGARSLGKAPGLTSALGQPTAPTITATVVSGTNLICGGRKVRYSVPVVPATWTTINVAQPTGYSWVIAGSGLNATEGTTYVVDSGSLSSNVFVIRYLSNTAQVSTDLISCAYTTACGTGVRSAGKAPGLTLALAQPTAPTVTAAVVAGTATTCYGRKVRYSVPAFPTSTTTAQAIGYNWSFVGTMHGTLGTTYVIDSADAGGLSASRVIVVRYLTNQASSASTTDSVRCAYATACGEGARGKVKVSVLAALTNCPPPITKVSAPATFGVNVYPNPSNGQFNVQLSGATSEVVNVRVLDAQGRYIKAVRAAGNGVITLGSDLKAGAYLLEVRQGNNVKTIRVLKF